VKHFVISLVIVLGSVFLMASLGYAVHVAPSFDTQCTGEGTTSATCDATVASDANIAIVCVAGRDSGGAVQPAVSASVEGQAATFLAGITNAGNVIRVDLFYKLSPITGANVTASATADSANEFTIVGMMTFKTVAQTSTFNTEKTAQGVTENAADINTLASAVGELGVLCGAGRTATGTASIVEPDPTSPVSTERFDHEYTGTDTAVRGWGYTEAGAASSIDMRVDYDEDASTQWATAAVSMRPLADSAAGFLRRRHQ